MRVRSRPHRVVTLPLLALALAAGACGGGGSHTRSAEPGEQARSHGAPTHGQASQPAPSGALAAWPHAKLLRRIAGEPLWIDGRRVRIDPTTVTCGGEGHGSRRGRDRVWERFTCVQPTFFGAGVAGPDAVFRVQPTGARSFRITDQRFSRY
jgi:hypothetical protein